MLNRTLDDISLPPCNCTRRCQAKLGIWGAVAKDAFNAYQPLESRPPSGTIQAEVRR